METGQNTFPRERTAFGTAACGLTPEEPGGLPVLTQRAPSRAALPGQGAGDRFKEDAAATLNHAAARSEEVISSPVLLKSCSSEKERLGVVLPEDVLARPHGPFQQKSRPRLGPLGQATVSATLAVTFPILLHLFSHHLCCLKQVVMAFHLLSCY